MHLDEALSMFLVQLDADGRSPHTVAQYARHVRAFERWLVATMRSTDLATITPAVVAQFFVDPAARCRSSDPVTPKKPTSLNAMRSTLRCCFAYAHDAGLIASNPARLLRRARCAPPPPRAIPTSDHAKLLATIDADASESAKRDGVLVRVLARTGLRISSALAIEITDLDNDAIEIRESKGDQRDRIPVSRETIQMLLSYVGTRTQGPIFLGRNGKALDRRHFARRLADWSRKAGLRRSVHPHQFRHGLALRLLDAGHDLRTVQQALRHRSIASTMQYTNVPDMRMSNALRDLETAS